MRHCLPSFCAALVLQGSAVSAADQIVVLGDSLSFAYEAEFGFQIEIQTGIFSSEVLGDGFGPEVRNWIEILDDPAYRNQHFDLGARDSIELQTFVLPARYETLFFRQEYNWSVPGYRIDQLRRFVAGEATITQILSENPEFAALETALDSSDFTEADFAVADLITQIQSSAERVVLFIGGNDINGVYGTIDNGGAPALEAAYPIRLPSSTMVALTPATTATLGEAFTPFTTAPTPGADGLARAILPMTDARGFLRLEATITP